MIYSQKTKISEKIILNEEVEEIAQKLRAKGKKLTNQRLQILVKICNFEEHFTAEQLEWSLKKDGKNNSKATIYRTLSLLLEHNFLESQDFGDGSKYYEKIGGGGHHDHLICVSCKKIIEFHNSEIERLQETVATHHHFQILYHSHRLFGVCSTCRNTNI
ncbi:MAG: transcriptional repressor [Planctomycetota bacterium]